MGFRQPVSVTKEDIKKGIIYYTPNYGGIIKVEFLKLLDDGTKALVKTKKGNPFVRELKFVFIDGQSAKNAGKDWEKSQRKNKKNKNKEINNIHGK